MIDTHAHLLPGVDDGCETIADSLTCARRLVAAGYARAFCTPHIWPSLPDNTIMHIRGALARLQAEIEDAGIPLSLHAGGELNLTPDLIRTPPEKLVTYATAGKFLLMDLWANTIPSYIPQTIEWLKSIGIQAILAHPERMSAVQNDPPCLQKFTDLGVLLQGNLQCFGDSPRTLTNQTAERFLAEGRYFMVGSDLHRPDSMNVRMRGLDRLRALSDAETFMTLTTTNPARLLKGFSQPPGESVRRVV